MPFTKLLPTPNGSLSFHKVTRLESSGDLTMVTMNVASWIDQAQYLTGVPALWNTPVIESINVQSLIDRLLSGDSAFAGAVPAADGNDTLAILQARAWAQQKLIRDSKEYADITFQSVAYDCDRDSVQRIIGANVLVLIEQVKWLIAQIAKTGVTLDPQPDTGVDWTAVDNTAHHLSDAEVQGLGVAVATQAGTAHAQARVVRAEIEAAPDASGITSVTWPSSPQPVQ